ncbi:manganese transport protein [Luteibacter jiangsuensis]|uniref:Divalent metal cation transporter MntH n=1 Tax=Luteibacter jiangsuensis TaxID=637577 RepID=A0ABT9SUG1_9GAMM|nr:Nramp family divalent metal transporter [Luteibacter jiangsuensis]MDQ0008628.1 manganese transport protein [Luteibacter jiangsuensis]
MLQKATPERPEEPAMREVLDGHRRGLSALLPFAGPAVVVSVAYIDPGNFATNIQAGARYGYALLWVVLMANLVAMLFQSLSARLGIVTGHSLAELCREHLPKPLVYVMWVVSELAAMATDLAEFLGGAIGLALLFDLPLLVGMGITAIVTYALLLLEGKGYRRLELTIGALVGVVGLAYLAELFIAPIGWRSLGQQIFVPSLPDGAAVAIAVGIIGATVMPHALFLHSGLTERRARPKTTDERRRIIGLSNLEVILALSVAGLINLAMVVMAAGAFHGSHPDVAKIETAYQTLVPLLGGAAATIFLISLIASGFSSSVVGTMAGQMIMQGFVNFRIPLWLRRAVTMLPSFAVVIAGVDATRALVLSQVALSIALPFPMIALVWFTSRRHVMGVFTNRPAVTLAAIVASLIVLSLNIVLLLDTFGLVSL